MAFRRRRRYTTRKRAPVRRVKRLPRRNYKKLRRVPRGISTQANIPRLQKIRYVQDISLSITAGAPSYYQFRANGVYDPDYTGAGHQPMRFDQMAQFYADYTVVGSKITVKHMGSGQSNSPFKEVLYLNDTNITSLLYVNDLIEQGRCKWRVTGDGVNNNATSISLGFSAKKFFGITNIKDNQSRIGAAVNNNPTDGAVFVYAIQPMDGSASIGTMYFQVVIDYLVWFSQPVQLASS